jgi:hypothetical protein
MNGMFDYLVYFVEIGVVTSFGGLIFIHFFIKIPSLLSAGEKPSFWVSFISQFAQHKDAKRFVDLAVQKQDSNLLLALKAERFFAYLLVLSVIAFLAGILFLK